MKIRHPLLRAAALSSLVFVVLGAPRAHAQPQADAAIAVGADEPASAEPRESFAVGSYGRVMVGADGQGGTGNPVRLVSHPPRLLESSYAELDLGTTHAHTGTGTTLLSQLTLAFSEQLFHFSGDFDASVAVRNFYLEVRDLGLAGLSVWGGSRMLRGDDIYLLDLWPLDDQNTVGGGIGWQRGATQVRAHVGVNRLDDAFQRRALEVPAADFGAREIEVLDRQRTVGTLRAEHHLELGPSWALEPVAYAEMHSLPAGSYLTQDGRRMDLPADGGWLVGGELALSRPGSATHANLFVRLGRGIAAYDELAVPYGLDEDERAAGAREIMVGLAGNYELGGRLGVLVGSYVRSFVDADPNVYDTDDVVEVAAAVRPGWFANEHVQLLGELNVQYLRPNGVSSETGRHDKPLAVQLALMPTVALDAGSYSRPQLRLVYAASLLNEAARLTYAARDPLRRREVQHYLGLSVEWWFNSSRYEGGV